MAIPEKLYRYRAGNSQDLTNLSAAKIWFSHPSRFNDPFDCAYDIRIPELSRSECEAILHKASDGRMTSAVCSKFDDTKLKEQVSAGLFQSVQTGLSASEGVCCFSEICDDLLMWGHYSDCHRGLCLEYTTALDPLFAKSRKVVYSPTVPKLDLTPFTDGNYEMILNLLLTKAKCWEYEKEWRVLHQKGNHSFGNERASLTGIYFGAKMPEENKLMIAKLMNLTDTKLYDMKLSKEEFQLHPELKLFTAYDYRSKKPGSRADDALASAK